ncbi:MAG: cupredoxin domain-containing protein [Chloroflexi bacterium]|nr:cupredoxin domain-containing protein [Chloroflexota bacterium]
MKAKQLAVLATGALAAAFIAAACGGGGTSPAPRATPVPATPVAQLQVKEVVIKASEWKFEPAIIRAKAGQPLKVVFQNWGQEDHDLVLKDLKGQEGEKQENLQELTGWMRQMGKEHMEGEEEHHGDEGAEMHDMHVDAEAGHMSSMVVTPMQPGTYQLVCSYEGHTDQGQKATLIVES